MNTLTCKCGAKLDVTTLAVGSRLRCKGCKGVLTVPKPEPPRVTATPERRPGGTHATHGAHGAHPAKPRKSGPNKTLIYGSLAGLIALIVVFVVLNRNHDKPTAGGGDAHEKGYEYLLKLHHPTTAREWFELATDCKANHFTKEYEESLEKAVSMSPDDSEIAGAYRELVASWVAALHRDARDFVDQYFAIGERIEKAGLKKDAEDIYIDIAGDGIKRNSQHPGIAPLNSKANAKLDRVLTPYGSYEDRETYEAVKDKLANFAERDKILAQLQPFERKVFLKREEFEKRGLKFKVKAEKPYMVAMQDSPGYAAELKADEFCQVVRDLYKTFRSEYAEKFGLEEIFEGEKAEEVLPIIVYDSHETYMAQNPGIPDWAGGHFSPVDGNIQIYMGVSDPYETIFHEGTHQLVAAATRIRGAKDTNTHWLTEGIACYFEAFKRDDQFQIHLGAVSQAYLPLVQLFAAKGKCTPFESFLGRDYGTFMEEQDAIEDPVRRKTFVDLAYAQSWAVVYFFRNFDSGKYRDKFDEYFKTEIEGKGSLDAFKKIFGDVKTIETEWTGYVKGLR